jgi:thioredoxin 1
MSNETENTNTENAAKPVAIAALNFKAEVLESKLPVLVEFWTYWSRPCRVSDSVLQEVARDLAGKIKVLKVNADNSLELSLCYEIQSIPTLIYFVGGKPSFRIVGTASKEAILAKLKSFSQ